MQSVSTKIAECPEGSEEIIISEEKTDSKGVKEVVRSYRRGAFLGKGGFARCYEAFNLESKKLHAIKIVSKETLKRSKAKQKLITEIKIHKSLQHKCIVGFDHVFEDSENIYIILELCRNHTLNEMMKKRKRISEIEVQYYITQIVEGLEYLHSNRVIHRDLKLGNLMIGDGMDIKIGDFGLAAKLEHASERRKTVCGTPNYLAPEIIEGKGHSIEVDVWSLGVIMYALLFGRPPFETNDAKKTYKKIKECEYAFNDDIPVSSHAKNLISRILIADPSKRITLEQIMMHPFMTNSKIPKTLPLTCLTSGLPRQFMEQFVNPSDLQERKLSRPDNSVSTSSSIKNSSDKILLRNTLSLSKNYNFFGKIPLKDETFKHLNSQTPTVLSNNFFGKPMSAKKRASGLLWSNPVYVTKWVDYSSKYGLGYLLSNDASGIYFNDSTKMAMDSTCSKFDYVSGTDSTKPRLRTFDASRTVDEREINKKTTLMHYFRKYLSSSNTNPVGKIATSEYGGNVPFFYVKKWLKSEKGIIFRLNNKVLQINFADKSQIVIDMQSQLLLFTGPGQQRLVLEIKAGFSKASEISNKMEIMKEMINQLGD